MSDRTRPKGSGLIVVGCSRSKTVTSTPVPALELYQGWCIPKLRSRIEERPDVRARVLILSARHGLISADTPIDTYDQAMTRERAEQLRPGCQAALVRQLADHPTDGALLLAEPLYLDALGPVLVADMQKVTRPMRDWDLVENALDCWGWV